VGIPNIVFIFVPELNTQVNDKSKKHIKILHPEKVTLLLH
jgi:hypothetical protein